MIPEKARCQNLYMYSPIPTLTPPLRTVKRYLQYQLLQARYFQIMPHQEFKCPRTVLEDMWRTCFRNLLIWSRDIIATDVGAGKTMLRVLARQKSFPK